MNLQHEDVRKCEKKGNYYVLFEARVDTTNVRGAGNMATVKRKHTVKPFSFNLPMWLTPFLDTYMSLSPDNGNSLLRNPQKRVKAGGAVFVQNLGKNNLGKWGKELALVLSKEKPDTYTTHCWRYSGATNLANNGGTELQLKRAGQWDSIKSACGYTEDRDLAREQQLDLLEQGVVKKHKENSVEVFKNQDTNVSVDTSTNRQSNSQANYGVGTINGKGSNVVVNNHFYNSPHVNHS